MIVGFSGFTPAGTPKFVSKAVWDAKDVNGGMATGAKYLDEGTLALLAQMLGTPAAADAVGARIEHDLQEAQARVPRALRGQRIYFEVDATPYAAGPGSFIGETLARLGMANAMPAELGPFPKLNPEYVVRAQPDIIMAARQSIVDMPRRPGWGVLRALQSHRTCGFDGERYDMLVRPGPRMGEAALLLADCLVALPAAAP